MGFAFATCDTKRAIEFLKVLYPNKEVTTEKVSKLMDLVGKDILRIEDPMMHKPAQVITGEKYDPKYNNEINEAIDQLKTNLHD